MSEEQLLKKYEEMDYILHLSDGFLWNDILRSVGGGIIFLLSWINNFIESIVDKIITFNNFYSSGPMKEFMDVARPVVWGVFFIALFVLGFQFMLNKVEKRNEVVLNIILALCFIVVIPDLMTNIGKITNQSIKIINPETDSLAGELVKSNVADVLYYAEKGFKYSSKKDGDSNLPPLPQSKGDPKVGTTNFTYANQLPKKNTWVYIPYTQKLDVHEKERKALEKLSDDAIEVLSNRAIPTGKGTSQTVQELKKNVMIGTGSLGRESYYRYHVNWLILISSLLVTTVALVITVVKIGRSIFDLAFHQVYGMFIAATDLTGGQRTKKVLTEIISTFAVIFIMAMLLKFFTMYSTWANGLKSSIGSIGVLLLLIAGAWALIDAPDIIQRTIGIDAGLRSGWQAMMGTYAAVKTGGVVGGMLSKSAGSLTNLVTGGVNFSKRAVEGMLTKTPEEIETGISKTKVKQIPSSANQITKAQIPNHIPNAGVQIDGKDSMVGTGTNAENLQVDRQTLSTNSMNNNPNMKQSEKEKLQKGVRIKERNSIPSQISSLQGKERKLNNVIPHGYGETTSGLLIPQSYLSASENSSIPTVEKSSISTISEQTGETISDAVSSKTTEISSVNRQETKSNNSSLSSSSNSNYGHKETVHPHTWLGGNRRVQRLKENWDRAGNSGFDLGQNIRRISLGTRKTAVDTTRTVLEKTKSIRESISNMPQTKEKQTKSMPKFSQNRKETNE